MPKSAAFREARDHAKRVVWVTPESANNPDEANYQSQTYREQMYAVQVVRDVYGGTRIMRKAGEAYLPKHAREEDDDYTSRLETAVLFNALKRTAAAFTGMVFRKDLMVDDCPFEADLDNIDLTGRDLTVFAKDVFLNGFLDGHTWVHVEYPEVNGGEIINRQHELDSGVRPYWLNIPKADVVNWRYEMRAGRPVLTLFVYREWVCEDEKRFGQTEIEQYRVLRPGGWEIWRQMGDKNDWRLYRDGTASVDHIPVVPFYSARTKPFESEPPLLDLAYENLKHYQIRSNHEYSLAFAGNPLPVFTGVKKKDIEWGAGRALFLPERDSGAMLLEAQGTALDSTRQELKDVEARMAALGLSMLVRETRAAETAEAKLLDKSESDSALGFAARNLENTLNQCLEVHASYGSGVKNPGTIQVNRDFHDQTMTAQMVQTLSGLVSVGQLSLDTLWGIMQTGEVLPEEFDPEIERDQLEIGELPEGV